MSTRAINSNEGRYEKNRAAPSQNQEIAQKPSVSLKNTAEKVQLLSPSIPVASQKQASSSGFSRKIDLLAGTSNKYSSLYDIQDSAQSAMRNTASLVQHFAGTNEVVGTVMGVDGAICSAGYMIVRGLTFRTALQRFPMAWEYGDWYDKLDAMVTIFRTFGGTVSSALGVGKNIGALVAWTALAIPATIAGIVFFSIWAIKGLFGISRLLSSYRQMNQAFESGGLSDKEKIQSLVSYFAQIDQSLSDESDELRGNEYMALKKELNELPPEDEEGRMEIQAKLSDLRDVAPELEGFLRDRTLARLTAKYGAGGVKRIHEYLSIQEKIEQFNRIKESLELDLAEGAITQEIFDSKIEELDEIESRFIHKSMKWFEDVKGSLRNGMVMQGILFIACVAGVAGGILSLVLAQYWMPIALGLSILASLLWIVFDAQNWQVQTEVTKSQKRWVREALSQYIDQEHLITERNVDLFSGYFLNQLEQQELINKEKEEKIALTKARIKHRILGDSRMDKLIHSEFINHLKKHHHEGLDSDEHDYLRHQINEALLSVGENQAQQDAIRQQLQTIKFIEGLLKGDQQERLGAIINNRHYKIAQFQEELETFVDSYASQIYQAG